MIKRLHFLAHPDDFKQLRLVYATIHRRHRLSCTLILSARNIRLTVPAVLGIHGLLSRLRPSYPHLFPPNLFSFVPIYSYYPRRCRSLPRSVSAIHYRTGSSIILPLRCLPVLLLDFSPSRSMGYQILTLAR